MEKNERYSRVNYPAFKVYKKLVKNYHEKAAIEILSQEIKNKIFVNGKFDITEASMAMGEMQIWKSMLNKECINYYLTTKELSDFLLKTKIKEEMLSEIINLIPKIKTNEYKNSIVFTGDDVLENKIMPGLISAGVVHLKSMERSIFFVFNYSGNGEKSSLIVSNGDDVSYLPLFGDKELRTNMNRNDIYGEMLRLILNLLFYMSAFPENVLNSPPDEECDKLNKNNSKTISISPTISEYLHENRDVQPHLRRGHFRFLGSDHFTKKRGQTIFVKASFVKGEAKTVIWLWV